MLEKARYEGAYPTPERADEAGRLDLAACVPLEAARVLTAQIPDTQPLTGWPSSRTSPPAPAHPWPRPGGTPAPSSQPLPPTPAPTLITRILSQLPTGYALLFGRAELTSSA